MAAFLAMLLAGSDPLQAARGIHRRGLRVRDAGNHTRFIDSARLSWELSLLA